MSLRWEETEKTLTCIEPTTAHGREFWKIAMDPDQEGRVRELGQLMSVSIFCFVFTCVFLITW